MNQLTRDMSLLVNTDLPFNLKVGFNMSIAHNLWGELEDSESAQSLYSADKVVAGVDFVDSLYRKIKL